MNIAGTGHRRLNGVVIELESPTAQLIKDQLYKLWDELRPERIFVGGATGFDLVMAYAALERQQFLTIAIPFEGYDKSWPDHIKKQYKRVLNDNMTTIVVVSEGGYAPWKFQKRNEFVVDNCELLLAGYDRISKGGTYNCIKYARKVGREIRYLKLSPYEEAP